MLSLFFLPLVELFRTIRNQKKRVIVRFFLGFVLFTLSLIVWVNAYTIGIVAGSTYLLQLADNIGIVGVPTHISGTGSMYPTFPKGKGKTIEEQANEDVAAPPMFRYPGGFYALNNWVWKYTLQRGDIVSFANDKTKKLIEKDGLDTSEVTGFVKRVVALPGDTIEIRNGFFILNGKQQAEPYTASARSTFGGSFLPDCKKVTIPDGEVFVMGDNRKASNDSRFDVGFVAMSEVERVLPWEQQKPYESLWRNTEKDFDQSNGAVLDSAEYLRQLNLIRKEHGVSALKAQPKLAESARLRALNMLKYNDLSFEATRSGYTMEKAMRDAGYSNIIWGEAPTLGYYTADELLDNYAEFPAWEKFLLDKRYQETGVAAVIGELNGCPVQLVVQHVAGYVPPNYKKADVESWKTGADNLRSVLPSWVASRGFGSQYENHKDDYERMISIINERISIADTIYNRMNANQWLNEQEKSLATKDKTLYSEQETLAKKLNER